MASGVQTPENYVHKMDAGVGDPSGELRVLADVVF